MDLKSSQERAEWLQSMAVQGRKFNPRIRLKPLAATLLAIGAIKQ